MNKTKQDYRHWAKEKRELLNIQLISSLICDNFSNSKEYIKAAKIAAFYPLPCEIDLTPLFQDKSKSFYLPVIKENREMDLCKYQECSELTLNQYGICEPCQGNEVEPEDLDLIIVPALVVDKKGHRLGYGKGYYDRFLSRLPENCTKIVPIASELIVDEIPYDNYDVPVDMVVTQFEVYNFCY